MYLPRKTTNYLLFRPFSHFQNFGIFEFMSHLSVEAGEPEEVRLS